VIPPSKHYVDFFFAVSLFILSNPCVGDTKLIGRTYSYLQGFPIGESTNDGAPPAHLRPKLELLRKEIMVRILEELGKAPLNESETNLKARVRKTIPITSSEAPFFGQVLDLELKKVWDQPQLVALLIRQAAVCGTDDSLYLISRSEKDSRIVYRKESAYQDHPYEVTSWPLTFLGKTSKVGPLFLVTSERRTTCTSNWRTHEIIVASQNGFDGDFKERARTFVTALEINDITDLENKGAGFKLIYQGHKLGFQSDAEFDSSEDTREERFSFDGQSVKRLPPIGSNLNESVFAWFEMDWSVAIQFSKGELTSLRNWHKQRDIFMEGKIETIHRCPNSTTQVLTMKLPDDPKSYFLVSEYSPRDFKMRSIRKGQAGNFSTVCSDLGK